MRRTGRRCGALPHSPRIPVELRTKPEAMMNCLRSRIIGKFPAHGQLSPRRDGYGGQVTCSPVSWEPFVSAGRPPVRERLLRPLMRSAFTYLCPLVPCRLTTHEGEHKQEHCCEPSAEANRFRHIHGNQDTASNQRCAQNSKLPHAVQEHKWKVVRSHHNHESWIKPSWSKCPDADHQWQREWESERHLNSKRIHRMSFRKRIGVPHASQQSLSQWKDEKSTQHKDQFSQAQRMPGASGC